MNENCNNCRGTGKLGIPLDEYSKYSKYPKCPICNGIGKIKTEVIMNIPRINTDTVKKIIANTDFTNKEKAVLIHDYDYDMSLRGSSKPVNRWDLVSVGVIEGELDKNGCDYGVNNPTREQHTDHHKRFFNPK